jgi:PAS domain S-box-containing protein
LHEFWHRLIAVTLFVVIGAIAQHLVNKRRHTMQRNAQLAAIVESSGEAIIGTTPDGNVTSWNPAAAALFGYSEDEMIGRSVSVLIPPDRRHELAEGFEQARLGQGVSIDETVRVTRDGEEIWASVSLSPVGDLKGDFTGASTIVRDITQQKRMREDLRRQKELYETLLNVQTALDVGFLISEGQQIVYANDAYCRITGYSAGELRAMPSIVETLVPPEGRTSAHERLSRRLEGDGPPEHYETVIVTKDGRRVDIEVGLKTLRQENGTRVVAIIRDISGRKRAEEELQARARQQAAVARLGQRALRQTDLAALMDETVALTAKTLNVEYCELLELLPESDDLLLRSGVGWKEGAVGHVTAEATLDSQVGYTLLFSEPVVVADLHEEKRFSGTHLLLNHGVVSGMSVVIQGRGKPYGVVGAHTRERRDFTGDDINFLRAIANVLAVAIERGRAEEALLGVQADERRRIARDLHDRVLQDLTDALQSMQATQVRSENLGQGADLTQEIGAIQRTVKGLRNAIYDLRQEEGLSFVQSVRSLLDLERQVIPGCEIELTVAEEFPVDLPPEVGTGLLRIIQEAMTNARRHSGSRHVRVSLGVGKDEVVVEVADDGDGFDPDASREGVGLAGMHERALALGGSLEIESQPGEGARVSFRAPLPALLEAGSEFQDFPELPDADGEREGQAVEKSTQTKRLLLVEDHVSFRQSLASTLKLHSEFERVAQVGSLAGAREVINDLEAEIGIAIVDLSLPDGTGLELIGELQDVNPHAKVLVLTASLDRQQRAWAVEAGAAGVLHKSASVDSIVRALRRLSAGESLLPPSEVVDLLRLALRQRERDREAKARLELLTRRELEVLRLLAEGLDGKMIARRLEITTKTEHTHMMNIFGKLGVHSRLEALVLAVRHGLVDIHSSASVWQSEEQA